MRKNHLRNILEKGKTIYNGWLHIPNTWTAELMAHAGWDSLTIDMQHGLHSIETAIQMLQAISTTDTIPLARVNWNEAGSIMRLLDGGAYGIICPMVNTKSDCEAFVGACRYPPLGYRSFGPTRARVYAGADYGAYANEEILCFAMVETKEAVENLDEICSVKGLDGIFVGSGDLKLSYTGKTGHGHHPQEFDAAIQAILASCVKHHLIPGIWSATVEAAQEMKEKGFRFIALKSDSMMLNEYTTTIVGKLRAGA
ncbi:MAG: aldolase/citrate lyase family protein [Bacteroidota bacterium]